MNTLTLFNQRLNPRFSSALFDEMEKNMLDFLPSFEDENRKMFNYLPSVDIKEEKDAYSLQMDLPGVCEKDVEISLNNRVLSIATKAEEKTEKKDEKFLLKERRTSSFERRFTLPEDVDGENISAEFKNGVLGISIPRKALASSRRIEIKAS